MWSPTSESATSDCLFCAVYRADERELAWYDRPLVKEQGIGVAICGVGGFVPGYVLVAPALHHSAVQGLPVDAGTRFVEFTRLVLRRVEGAYGPATIFEHGSCRSDERRRSACITHSHVHIIPGFYSFDSLRLSVRVYDALSDLLEAPERERTDGYLMYQEPGGPLCYAPDAGVSQYFRRHIAHTLGCPTEWDYALYPRWPNLRATQQRLLAEADSGAPSAGHV